MFVCGPIGHFSREIRAFMCIFTPSMVLFTRHFGLQQSTGTADSLCPVGPVEVSLQRLQQSTAVYSSLQSTGLQQSTVYSVYNSPQEDDCFTTVKI